MVSMRKMRPSPPPGGEMERTGEAVGAASSAGAALGLGCDARLRGGNTNSLAAGKGQESRVNTQR